MTPERWRQVKQVVQDALEREPAQQAAFVAGACSGDEWLRREVESLLANREQQTGFLEVSAITAAARVLAEDEKDPVEGRRIGPYKVLHEIGRGGMGTVYLVVRDDDQYRQHAAMKLVRRGMDTNVVVRRFRRERQILANLNHPNIARLLDGGATEDGLSYFVMEYVEGVPVDQYCDKHKLPTIERLKLFRTICAAVEYAHRNLVIHRDLKPSNILVTEGAVPKLLDFGIAKLLDPDPSSPVTETIGSWLMTPEYASPEQVCGSVITTASDVYSLGVLLCELLTGRRPYRFKSRLPHEVVQVICQVEPEKPSTIVLRTAEGANAESGAPVILTPERISATRDGRPEKLRRAFAGGHRQHCAEGAPQRTGAKVPLGRTILRGYSPPPE